MENSKILALTVFKALSSPQEDRILVICRNSRILEKRFKQELPPKSIIPKVFFLELCPNTDKMRGYRGNIILVEGRSSEASEEFVNEFLIPLFACRFKHNERQYVLGKFGCCPANWDRPNELIFSED